MTDPEGLQFLGERKVTEGLGMWELELETSKACEHWGDGMHERLVVVNVSELEIAFWWNKLSININTVTDTSDSIFSASVDGL